VSAAHADALHRMLTAWSTVLTSVVGASDALMLAEVVEHLAPVRRRVAHAEELDYLASMGDWPGRRAAVLAKARRTCRLLLAREDGWLEAALGDDVPGATWSRLLAVARRLRDHAPESVAEVTALQETT
jgi:hypothetical protein